MLGATESQFHNILSFYPFKKRTLMNLIQVWTFLLLYIFTSRLFSDCSISKQDFGSFARLIHDPMTRRFLLKNKWMIKLYYFTDCAQIRGRMGHWHQRRQRKVFLRKWRRIYGKLRWRREAGRRPARQGW